MRGRPVVSARTGPGYGLAEYLTANFSRQCGMTNEEVAKELGYRSANVLSLWKTGKSRVPLERLPDLARLMKVDLAELLPWWMEQYAPDTSRYTAAGKPSGVHSKTYEAIREVFDRIATAHESPLLKAIRSGLASAPPRALTGNELKAHKLLAGDPSLAGAVLAEAAKRTSTR